MRAIDWHSKALFYVIEIGELRKFGITRNWGNRRKYYEKWFPKKEIKIHLMDPFEKYWQADLVEGIVRERLQPWIYINKKEWVVDSLPIVCIKDCFFETKAFLEKEYDIHENLHWHGKQRYAYYKQLHDILKDKFPSANPES